MNWKSNRKLKTAVLASVMALSMSNSVLGATTYESIGTGNYSWDKDWDFLIDSDHESSGDDYYSSETRLKYVASTGSLYWYEKMDGNSFRNYEKYVLLGNAQDIFGEGITEDEIKDLISNVQGDQTVNGSQDITGDQTVEGEQAAYYFFKI